MQTLGEPGTKIVIIRRVHVHVPHPLKKYILPLLNTEAVLGVACLLGGP